MVRQYLSVLATSAGVERLFSKATLVYDDLAQAMKEETLGYALFASYNYSQARSQEVWRGGSINTTAGLLSSLSGGGGGGGPLAIGQIQIASRD